MAGPHGSGVLSFDVGRMHLGRQQDQQ
jgi:hypothetical protein